MDPQTWYWIILIGANVPLYLLGAWAIFGTWDGFLESVRYRLTPDAWSWSRGEYFDDMWAEMKLVIFLGGCAGCVALEHLMLQKYVFAPT